MVVMMTKKTLAPIIRHKGSGTQVQTSLTLFLEHWANNCTI